MTDARTTAQEQVRRLADGLVVEYAGRVPDPTVRMLVDNAYSPLQDAPVQQFVPALVARTVRQRLRDAKDQPPTVG
jgi:predicted RecB family endonuclease